jgi:hypothetical protein
MLYLLIDDECPIEVPAINAREPEPKPPPLV